MAIDSALKRSSCLGLALPAGRTLPPPASGIDSPDRQHLALCYAGISAAPGGGGDGGLARGTFIAPRARPYRVPVDYPAARRDRPAVRPAEADGAAAFALPARLPGWRALPAAARAGVSVPVPAAALPWRWPAPGASAAAVAAGAAAVVGYSARAAHAAGGAAARLRAARYSAAVERARLQGEVRAEDAVLLGGGDLDVLLLLGD